MKNIFLILILLTFFLNLSLEQTSITDTLSKDLIVVYDVSLVNPLIKHGRYEQYYKGNLVKEGMYEDSIRTGNWIFYNGKNFRTSGTYNNDQKQDDWYVIRGKDTIAIITYEEDKPIKVFTPYDKKIRKAYGKSIDVKTIETLDAMPVFEGGNLDKFRAYVNNNFVFPRLNAGIPAQGKIYIEFIVNEIGQIQDVKVLHSLFPAMDKMAVKVIQNSPPWIPGIKDGEPVKVKFIFPIVFKL